MKSLLRTVSEHTVPLAIALALSLVTSIFTGMLEGAERIAATVGAGIAGYLIADRLYLMQRLSSVEASLAQRLGLIEAGLVNRLSSIEAIASAKQEVVVKRLTLEGGLEHIIANLERAVVVRNTRFKAHGSKGWGAKISHFDDAVAAELKREHSLLSLELIFSSEGRKHSTAFLKAEDQRIQHFDIGDCPYPLPQMTILEYADEAQDVMFGWDYGTLTMAQSHVILLRCPKASSEAAVFSALFEQYKAVSRRPRTSPIRREG